MSLRVFEERARYRTGPGGGGLESTAVQGADEHTVQAVEVVELDPEPASVGRARRFVAACVERLGLEVLGPDASLVISELTSNAVIHARTPVEVRLRALEGGIRIEVRDGVEHGPAPADDALAGPGLGLRVVARLASRWGVDPMPDGKIVWAELGAVRQSPPVPELGLGPAPLPLPDDWPEVRLADVPTRLLLAWEAHTRELIREFSLLAPAAGRGGDAGDDRVRAVRAVLERFWDLVRSVWAQAHAAGDHEDGQIRVVTRVPDRVVLDAPQFLDALEEADALAEAGRLLTGPTPEEVAAFGRWFVDAVVTQVVDGADAAEARCPFSP